MSKNYFWLKLHDDFFTRKEIKKLRSIAGGDTYTIIYLKLLLVAMKSDGLIYFDNIDDDIFSELALEIDENIDNVKMTLIALEKMGMVETNIEWCKFHEISMLTGKETESARRVRRHRSTKALQCNEHVTNGNTEIDKELNIDKDIDSENSPNFTPHADDFFDVVDMREPNDSSPKKESTSSARLEKLNALIKRYEQAICDTTGKKYTLDTNKANQSAMKKLIELTGGDEQAIIETAKRSVRYYTEVGTSMHENGKNASGVFVNIGRLPAHVSKYSDILNASQYSKSSTNGMRPHRLASDIDPNMITPQ